jgi:hypothetical protein
VSLGVEVRTQFTGNLIDQIVRYLISDDDTAVRRKRPNYRFWVRFVVKGLKQNHSQGRSILNGTLEFYVKTNILIMIGLSIATR